MFGDRQMYKKAQTNSRTGRQTDTGIYSWHKESYGWLTEIQYTIDSNAGWQACQLHCKEDPVYVFPEKKLRCLVLNFNIHVSVSDLYIPTIGPIILLQLIMQID